jgi:magnesium chelatase subunit D
MIALPPSQASASQDWAWQDAVLAAAVFAVDPAGLAGISVKARVGPVRDRWLALLTDFLPASAPMRRIPVNIADGRLLGGLDLSATLQAGRPIAERGLLAEADGGIVLLTMAERLEAATIARLGAVIDSGEICVERDGIGLRIPSRFGVVAFDESVAEDERPHASLLDRLALHLELDTIGIRDTIDSGPNREGIAAGRARLSSVRFDDAILKAICATAMALGVVSMRPSLLALRAARAVAALAGHDEIQAEDAAIAARLVLAPRATILPAAEPSQPEPSEPQKQEASAEPNESPPRSDDGEPSKSQTVDSEHPLEDIVLAAAQAAIPAGLLAELRLGQPSRARAISSGTAGVLRHSPRRGRPVGVRKGDLRGGARLNLIETLRAAVPWQRLRRGILPDGAKAGRVEVRRDDFRIARMKQRTETTTIFVVDASGSSALNRLAEAKGAIELLLGECYVRRDKVALVAFRGRGADLLLPPTRSLVLAKRRLANLPGGGGTPLAAGIDAAAALADGVRRQGATPVIIVMTDGHANVARGGKTGRPQAEADARSAATAMRAAGLTALLVDTSPRAQPLASRLAMDMGATYLPLPAADAAMLSRNVRAAGLRSQTGYQVAV